MQLILTNLFRPKWQHPRVDVRKKAVGNLNPEQQSDQSILEQIAREDRDVEVRCQAIDKLNDCDCLAHLACHDPAPAIQARARNRLCQLVTGLTDYPPALTTRLNLLEVLDAPDYLLHIALRGDDFKIRQEAVLRLADQAALGQIIQNADNHQLRQLAAEGIHDPEQLQHLIRTCRQRDKGVYRILKNRLDQQRQQSVEEQLRLTTQEQLCSALEKLAETAVATHYQAKLNALIQQWSTLDFAPDTAFLARFDKARSQCQLKADRYAEELQAREQEAQTRQMQAQLIEHAQQLCTQLLQEPADDQTLPIEQLQQLQQQWQQLAVESRASQTDCQRFEQTIRQATERMQHWQRYLKLLPELQACNTPQTLASLLDQLAWPHELPTTATLQAVHQRIKATQKTAPPQVDLGPLRQRLDQLQQALDEGLLADAGALIHPLREQQNKLPRSLRNQFKQLNARYQELQDWQQFATQPKLEQLCQAMHALTTEQTLSDSQRAERLRALQKQWKQLDGPQVANSLRQQFQQANEQVYTLCRDYFDQQRQQRQHNLNQRERLCEQLDHLITQLQHDDVELKTLTAQDRQLRSDWRRFSPVERGPGKKLQKRFNRGLKLLQGHIDQRRRSHGEQKTALVEQTEALLQSSDDICQRWQQTQQLQQQWKQLGATSRDLEQQLWQRFSHACNALHQQARQARAGEEEQARQQASDLCQQLEQSDAPLEFSVTRLRQQFDQLTAPLDDDRRLRRRFSHALTAYQLRLHPQEPDWQALNQLDNLCHELEKALLDGEPGDSALLDQAGTLITQLHADVQQAATERLALLKQLSTAPNALDKTVAQCDYQLRLLCIRREILCNHPSPEEDQALRMEYQMSRLQDALQQTEDQVADIDALLSLQRQWLVVTFNGFFEELRNRFEQTACD